MHQASLEILERVGVRLHHQTAVDLLRGAGATVSDGNLVQIPADLVEKALSTAPKRIVLYDRNGDPAVFLEGNHCYYGPGSDTLNIVDHRGRKRRSPLLKDVVEGTIICDALDNVDFVMSMVLPTDVDQTIADRYQTEAMLSNTTKPIILVSYDFEGLLDALEMTEIVVGGSSRLARNPMVAVYINVTSGLTHNRDSLDKLLHLSAKGLPSIYVPVSTSGASSPVTVAGSIAVDNAGALAGLVISQLVREGAPFIMPGMQHSPLDMRTMISTYCEPERGLAQALAKFYRLPSFALGGVSEAKAVDQQAAAEAALTLMTETLSGGNLIHDLGYLESGRSFSLAQLLICSEILSWIQAFFNRVEISDETLAIDLIQQYRDTDAWLGSKHTLRNYRNRWYPSLFERASYEFWQNKGGKTLGERACEKVEQLLSQHKPESLPTDVAMRLREIIRRAESKVKGR